MRHILLFFFAGLISIDSQAQRIASSILLQDGTTTDSSHVFVDGEMPTFHFEGHQCENVFWSFSLFDQDGEKMICKDLPAQFKFTQGSWEREAVISNADMGNHVIHDAEHATRIYRL